MVKYSSLKNIFMKFMLVLLLALFILGPAIAFGIKGTNFDQVQFIQYSDDNTAVEEVKNGHLDIYYSAIPVDRLDDKSRQNLNVFQSAGTSYSLLINPAVSEEFNRSEEHTSELQSPKDLVCRLLLEK